VAADRASQDEQREKSQPLHAASVCQGRTPALHFGMALAEGGLLSSILEWLPEPLQTFLTPGMLTAIAVFSVVMFVASVVAVPWFFCHIPADHYSDHERHSMPFVPPGSVWRPPLLVLKNVVGILLIVAGVLMLVLPGQGLLTIAAGLMLVNFPGKRPFLRWLVSRKPVYAAINALRRRAHQPPLELQG
jgi:drug/metabolite transporter (DMT)-like permease